MTNSQRYQGIKIFDKVIIVEKTETTDENGYRYRGRTVNQGYVVDPNNKDSLENAKKWAKWWKYDKSLNEKYWEIRNQKGWDNPETQEAYNNWQNSRESIPGIIHEYNNGQFEIILDEAAGCSSQSGKLSFWNCVIKAPDGNQFLIGINSELLLHLLMSNTFINGECQNKVWLGRVKGSQVGAFTENMEDFAQAKVDESMRKASRTVKYQPGDVVSSLKSTDVYLGPVYFMFDFTPSRGDKNQPYNLWGYNTYHPATLVIYRDVHIKHLFSELNDDGSVKIPRYYIDLQSNKPSRIIDKHIELEGSAMHYLNKMLESRKNSGWDIDIYYFYFGSKEEALSHKDEIIAYYKDKYPDLSIEYAD